MGGLKGGFDMERGTGAVGGMAIWICSQVPRAKVGEVRGYNNGQIRNESPPDALLCPSKEIID